MSRPRRNIIRQSALLPSVELARLERRRVRLNAKIAQALAARSRWWKKLERAATFVFKQDKLIGRLQRQLKKLDVPCATAIVQ